MDVLCQWRQMIRSATQNPDPDWIAARIMQGGACAAPADAEMYLKFQTRW